jgi:hypothetical protein
MSSLEISTAVFPTLTLVWNYLQVNLQFHEDLEVKDRSQNADSFSLVDAERETF